MVLSGHVSGSNMPVRLFAGSAEHGGRLWPKRHTCLQVCSAHLRHRFSCVGNFFSDDWEGTGTGRQYVYWKITACL